MLVWVASGIQDGRDAGLDLHVLDDLDGSTQYCDSIYYLKLAKYASYVHFYHFPISLMHEITHNKQNSLFFREQLKA